MCNWPMIVGIVVSAVVWCSMIGLAALWYGLFAMQQYSGVK